MISKIEGILMIYPRVRATENEADNSEQDNRRLPSPLTTPSLTLTPRRRFMTVIINIDIESNSPRILVKSPFNALEFKTVSRGLISRGLLILAVVVVVRGRTIP